MLSESIKEIKSIDCQCPFHCYTIEFAISTTQYINNKDKSYIPSNSNKTDSPYISPSKVQVDRIYNKYVLQHFIFADLRKTLPRTPIRPFQFPPVSPDKIIISSPFPYHFTNWSVYLCCYFIIIAIVNRFSTSSAAAHTEQHKSIFFPQPIIPKGSDEPRDRTTHSPGKDIPFYYHLLEGFYWRRRRKNEKEKIIDITSGRFLLLDQ